MSGPIGPTPFAGGMAPFSMPYGAAATHSAVRDSIVKGEYTVTDSRDVFAYSKEDAAVKLNRHSHEPISLSRDGYTATFSRGNHYDPIPSLHFSTGTKPPSVLPSIGVADIALAPNGILFVQGYDILQIYDLTKPVRSCGMTFSEATLLHTLRFQFSKITWDEEKGCLIGLNAPFTPKEHTATELKFEPAAALAVAPIAALAVEAIAAPAITPTKPPIGLGTKIAYTAKRILKIIVVEGPLNAYKGTKKGLELLALSKRKLTVIVGLGALGTALFATGLLVGALAPPIFALLALPATVIGSGLIGLVITPLIFPPFFGVISGVWLTLSSLNKLRKEEVFQ